MTTRGEVAGRANGNAERPSAPNPTGRPYDPRRCGGP